MIVMIEKCYVMFLNSFNFIRGDIGWLKMLFYFFINFEVIKVNIFFILKLSCI